MRTSANVLIIACFIAAVIGEHATHGSEVKLQHAKFSRLIFWSNAPAALAVSTYLVHPPEVAPKPMSNAA
jgi:hypothetical protein